MRTLETVQAEGTSGANINAFATHGKQEADGSMAGIRQCCPRLLHSPAAASCMSVQKVHSQSAEKKIAMPTKLLIL
ncbi:hypothetical protein DPQ33_00595 [Oceanidesulfovibrio indonesiensis]|uniref:Uncharacterized protein n=1 Tax=Oceanidesulfovibrio indonesiensis TaxID=54767 RepID=A0A7M3MJA7_9BACT|nr:hypothetical protein DPQ33_00595 [Oceanidesulfovibrio indonesiensis]